RHRADTAGYWGQRLRDRFDTRAVDVARELASLGIARDADVDHDRARLDMLAGDETAFARGGDQDVGGPGNGGQVDGVRVSDRHGRMVLKEEEGQRAPDQAGASHDDGALAGGVDVFAPEQLEDAER